MWVELIGRTVAIGQERCHDKCQNSPEMGKDLADILAAGAQGSEDRIICHSPEHPACQLTIAVHVPYLGVNRTSPSQEFCQQGRDAVTRTADQDTCAA